MLVEVGEGVDVVVPIGQHISSRYHLQNGVMVVSMIRSHVSHRQRSSRHFFKDNFVSSMLRQ